MTKHSPDISPQLIADAFGVDGFVAPDAPPEDNDGTSPDFELELEIRDDSEGGQF
jgi:hypothetical protein